jgi:hypothetical protein
MRTDVEDASELRTPLDALTPLRDASVRNANFNWETTTGLQKTVTDLIGTEVNGKTVLPYGPNEPGTVAWQIDAGWKQDTSDGVITFGFFTGQHAVGLNNNPKYGEGKGYSPFTEAQKAAARIAITNWDDLIAAKFVEVQQGPGVSNWAQKNIDIMLANTTTGPAQAWAYYPGYGGRDERIAGDVWVADPRINSSNNQFLPGQYGLQTLNHELGHALGLSHPGTYNFGDDSDGDGQPDPINYTGDAQYFQDSNQFSIMSYFDSYETGAQNIDWNVMRFLYPSTPMVDDVYVVQQKYGADMTTRTGDTVYGFNSTADVTNEAMKFKAGEMFTIFTIWDAGGKDTLDLSGYHTPSIIDLREGAYSSAGGYGAYNAAEVGTAPTLAAINAHNAAAGLPSRSAALFKTYFEGTAGVNEGISWKTITGTTDQYLMGQNIGIAFGAIIENAIGGHGNDRINGNQANNEFTGNGGADTFVIANYSGMIPKPGSATGVMVTDTSVDKIMDFSRAQGDKIDLSALKVSYADLQFNDSTDTVTVNTSMGELKFIIVGASDILISDFIFG